MKRDAHDGVYIDAVGKTGAESMLELRSKGRGEAINVSAAPHASCEIGGCGMKRSEQMAAQRLPIKYFTKK
jgi:hypothetical protein